ncbi:MAG TPA: DUF3090 family protein [Chloroflexota bacterium]|jgi:uncharacterized repeat protein (TIGR03847 family)
MADAQHEFGLATRLEADALGEPGNRTFRLLVRSGSSSALIWIEKAELVALAVTLEQVLVQVAPAEVAAAEIAPRPGPVQDFPLNPTVEFRVGQLQLGHDAMNEQFQLFATDVEQMDQNQPVATLSLRMHYQMAGKLCQQIAALAASGRPLCPLCGQPMGPGPHSCPLSNGHIH